MNVRNSIFLGGLQRTTVAGTGRYVHAGSAGVVNVDYCMFDLTNTVAVAGPGAVTIAESCMTNNPCFVSGNSLDLAVRNPTTLWMAYDDDQEVKAVSGDVHLVSAAGYVDNAGAYHDGGSVVSPAIDAASSTSAPSATPPRLRAPTS